MLRQHILVIANPKAGSADKRRLGRMIARMETLGCSVTVYKTSARGDAERFVASTDCSRFDAIAAAGGDGTINEVLNGLPQDGPPLAVLPLGTVNVLAKEIGLPRSMDEIAETVVFGPKRRISVGEANGRRFAVMASVGLDAMVVDRLDPDLKHRIGKWAYLFEMARQCMLAPPLNYNLRIDAGDPHADEQYSVKGIVVANGQHYAGRYVAAPDAHLQKPCLSVCRLTKPGRLAAPSYFLSMVLGRLFERKDYQIIEATSLEILGPEGAPLQGDGDLLCRLPATIRILPDAVDLVFPLTAPPIPASPWPGNDFSGPPAP